MFLLEYSMPADFYFNYIKSTASCAECRLKFLFLEFTALNLLPSIPTTSPPKRSSCLKKKTNDLNNFFIASGLSFRKSAIVLKSGVRFFSNHITSRFLEHSFINFLLERRLLRYP